MNDKLKKGITIGSVALILGGGIVYGDLNKNEISKEKMTAKYEQAIEIKAKYQIDGTSLKREVIKNAELDKYKGEPKDKIEVVLGDKNSTDFTPDIEMKRWNEVSFKIKPRLNGVATKDKELSFEGDKVKFKTPKMDFEMYDIPATANDEGSYKYIWYLNVAPTTNKIEFDIETTGLDFFYQPELTAEEIAQGAFRPENVVGSYAVYHQTKGGMNDSAGKEYKAGKAFHIYRPKIIDAVGKETWGNLHIENGIYSVEIPQDFLDKAVYPIKSNDNFGYETQGTAGQYYMTNKIIGSLFTLNQIGVGVSITALGMETDGNDPMFKFALYNHTDLSFIQKTNESSNPSGDITLNFTSQPELSIGNYLIVGWGTTSGGDVYFWYDDGDTNQGHHSNLTYATNFPNPLVPTHNTNKYSIYATYSPAAGTPTPNNDIIIFE